MAYLFIIPLLSSAALSAPFNDIGAGLTGVHQGSAIWGDFDNDNDLDIFLIGEKAPASYFGDIYKNSGGGTFTTIGAGLPALAGGTNNNRSAWGDFDNDGDLDLVVTGYDLSGNPVTDVYQNNSGAFTAVTVGPSPLIPVGVSSVAWGDYDNDGDLDLFVAGYDAASNPSTRIYRNDGPASGGGWTFTDVTFPGIAQVGSADGAWGDYDNDGDLDLVVTGYDAASTPLTRVYRNDGGTLVNTAISNIVSVGEGSVAWGDYDNDGYLDLAVTGMGSRARNFRIYHNNQDGTFTQTAAINGFSNGSVAWGDGNNDGNLDLLVSGLQGTGVGTPTTDVYTGNGTGGFTVLGTGLAGVYESQATWGDYDNDGRLDILVAGRQTAAGSLISKIYRNVMNIPTNKTPSVPTGLTLATAGQSITAIWNPSTDAITPSSTMLYNIYVNDVTAGTTVMPAMADNANGYRLVPQLGNTDHDLTWTIGGLTPGHSYTVCVQAIDQGFIGSDFACSTATTTTDLTEKPDIMIGDCQWDVGTEPNYDCGEFWYSPNIYVRNQQDGFTNTWHQSPIAGQTNWVYVQLNNIGAATLATGVVQVYFAKASTGLGWPNSWTGNYINGIVYGDCIGQQTISSVGPGSPLTVEIRWDNVPDPSNYNDPEAHHFCMLARFTSPADPITFAETIYHPANVQNNNNLAWKNVSIIDVQHPVAPIEVHNIQPEPVTANLTIEIPEEENNDPVTNHVTVQIDLGERLTEAWQEAGSKGEGFKEVPGKPTVFELTGTRMTLDEIPLGADQQETAHLIFNFPADIDQAVAGHAFHLNLVQGELADDGTYRTIGGENYQITMPTNGEGKRTAPNGGNLAEALQLAAHPNPTSAKTTISYRLPADTRVTLALYDATGALVRTLVKADQKAGAHEIEWDGTMAGGAAVASGVYFYRIETSDGTAQGRLSITR